MKCPAAWDITKGSSSVIIAIVDTGVELTHPDLASKLVPGTDVINGDSDPTDDNGHGTHCAGIAAAMTNNGLGIAGVAPNCSIMPVKVLDSSGSGYLSTIAQGIRWAVDHGAKVISLSLGSTSQTQTLQDAVTYATSNGALVVAAAGNDNSSAKLYPAACTGALSVGAVNSNDSRASFSNYGSWVSVAAPGVNILSCWTGSQYANASGTSMATPHVAGLAALLYSYFGTTSTSASIKSRIESNCDNIGTWLAHGRVNALAALTGTSGDNVNATPSDGTVNASSFSVTQGSLLSGTMSSMNASDDNRAVFTSTAPRKCVFEGYATFGVGSASTIQSIVLNFECSGTTNGSLTFYAYNVQKNKWVSFTSFSLKKVDCAGYLKLKLKWAQFVNSAGDLRIKVLRSSYAKQAFTVSIDRFNLTLTTL
jgi:thermitase